MVSERVARSYDGCYRRLVAQVYALTADLAEAQDAVQEAFVRALAQPRAFERWTTRRRGCGWSRSTSPAAASAGARTWTGCCAARR